MPTPISKREFLRVMESRTHTELLSLFFALCKYDKRILRKEIGKHSPKALEKAALCVGWVFEIKSAIK